MDPERFTPSRFESLAERYKEELRLHEHPGGLWEKDATGKDWRNVTEHCLLEAARAEVLAKKLAFDEALAADLSKAATLHDFYKKFDIQYTREDIAAGGTGEAGSLRSEAEGEEYLRKAGYSERIIRMIQSVGGDPQKLLFFTRLISKPDISDEDLALAVMHYIDDYTAGNAPAAAPHDGKNDVDIRMERNAANADYQAMNLAAKDAYKGTSLEGMTRFEAQAAVAHAIEKKISEEIASRTGEHIDPLRLPEVVESELAG